MEGSINRAKLHVYSAFASLMINFVYVNYVLKKITSYQDFSIKLTKRGGETLTNTHQFATQQVSQFAVIM